MIRFRGCYLLHSKFGIRNIKALVLIPPACARARAREGSAVVSGVAWKSSGSQFLIGLANPGRTKLDPKIVYRRCVG